MPKIYEYLGIIFLIYTDDHLPIHVHAQYAEYENKIELYYVDGILDSVLFQKVRGKEELPGSQKKIALKMIQEHHLGIVQKWNDVMVFGRKPAFEKLEKSKKNESYQCFIY